MKTESTKIKQGGKAAWAVLIVLMLLNTINYMDRMVISVAMESMKLDMGFSDAQMGLIQGVFFLSVGLMTLPAGVMIDRWSKKKAVSLMAIVWSIGTVGTGMAGGLKTIIIGRIGCGAGEAAFQPGGFSWLSVMFPKNSRAKINGIFQMGAPLGCMAGMILGGVLITQTGNWRTPFYVFGIPGIVLGLITLLLQDVKPDKTQNTEKVSLISDLRDMLKVRSFIGSFMGQGLFLVTAMAAQSWQVVLMMRAYELNEAKAGTMLGLMIIPALIAPFAGGWIADKMQTRISYGRPLLSAIGCLLGSTAYVAQFWLAGSLPLSGYMVILLTAAFLGALPTANFQSVAMDVFPLHKRGKAASMIALVTFLIFSWWGSMLVGVMSDFLGGGLYGVKIALMCLVPTGFLAALIVFWSCKYYPKESAAIDALEEESDQIQVTAH